MLARDVNGKALWVADEDQQVLRRVALPLSTTLQQAELKLPGAPAQVLPLDDGVLLTVREPALLLRVVAMADGTLAERARLSLPADAWGVAVSDDLTLAVVTSAWSSMVSGVDLASMTLRWTVPVAREPRGVVIDQRRGHAYISHLTRAKLTKLTQLGTAAKVSDITLPSAPLLSAPDNSRMSSLGYALAISPSNDRLFALRRGLGSYGYRAWAGSDTIDALLLPSDQPLAVRPKVQQRYRRRVSFSTDTGEQHVTGPAVIKYALSHARAVVYAARSHNLVVAYEGSNHIGIHPAKALAPALSRVAVYSTLLSETDARLDTRMGQLRCGAPSGLALSQDERQVYVYCRSTHNLLRLHLRVADGLLLKSERQIFQLSSPPLSPQAELGRRLFYRADDEVMTWGMSCAGCHPDGRDDGHVWIALTHAGRPTARRRARHGFLAVPVPRYLGWRNLRGEPRQTPMLAGHIGQDGPFGWKAHEKTLEDRVLRGFVDHRWFADKDVSTAGATTRARALVAFLHEGLRAPPQQQTPLTAEQRRGAAVFSDDKVGCASCHRPKTHFSDSTVHEATAPPYDAKGRFAGFEPPLYRTPSLLFVGGTAPYFHDGSAATLEDVINHNGDRMGFTSQLSAADKTALVAYLNAL